MATSYYPKNYKALYPIRHTNKLAGWAPQVVLPAKITKRIIKPHKSLNVQVVKPKSR